jgi:hypothetical protein
LRRHSRGVLARLLIGRRLVGLRLVRRGLVACSAATAPLKTALSPLVSLIVITAPSAPG